MSSRRAGSHEGGSVRPGASAPGLTEFIRSHLDSLAKEWEGFARTQLPAARGLTAEELEDSARELLQALADDMDSPQSEEEQAAKSQGSRPGNAPSIVSYAHRHAATRLAQDFTVEQMSSEYRALRATVLRGWCAEAHPEPSDIQSVIRFSESVDEAWLESMAWYGERVNQARNLFIGALGHDLRTPLGAITMSAQLLMRDLTLSGTSMKAAVRTFNSASRMRRMIEDLLDFTRVRLGRLPIGLKPCSLAIVFRQTVEELSAAHPDSEIRYSCDGDLYGEWDDQRMSQVLSNLVSNAVQHANPMTPVTVAVHGTDDGVMVTVHNQGPPIAQEVQKKIFDPLMRRIAQEGERRGHEGGLGLGLFICDEIVRAHGGHIDVSSSQEAGTTFIVVLPKNRERAHGRKQRT
jgi:signal transduction histidine kinase